MGIRLVCKCGQKLRVENAHAGQRVVCPKCGQNLSVPSSPASPATTPSFDPAPAPDVQSPNPTTSPPHVYRGSEPRLTLQDLRDRGETTAGVVLALFAIPVWIVLAVLIVMSYGMWLIFIGIGVLVGLATRLFMLAHVKTHAVEVTATQFPEIDRAARLACGRLGIEKPHIYVMQSSLWNAWAAKLAGRRIVVLLSGAIDSILLKGDAKELAWVVGHEIGHHAAGHFGIWRRLVAMGGWFPAVLLWYRRRGELTCDNIGLYAAGLEASLKAMSNATVGAQLASQLNTGQAIEQWEGHRREFFVRYRTLYSSHPPNLWRIKNLVETAKRLHIAP